MLGWLLPLSHFLRVETYGEMPMRRRQERKYLGPLETECERLVITHIVAQGKVVLQALVILFLHQHLPVVGTQQLVLEQLLRMQSRSVRAGSS